MRRLFQTGAICVALTALSACERYPHFSPDELGTTFTPTDSTASIDIPVYTFEVVNTYPHDADSFTQGLVYHDGFLYEGTGQSPYFGPNSSENGVSTLRKVVLETGEVVQSIQLDRRHFGEGIVVVGDEIVQLTWVSQVGFVYDLNTFALKREFFYQTEGWGITHDGARYVMSDGTTRLYFRDGSLNLAGHVDVRDDRGLVSRLNELEAIKGEIWANVWQTDLIARINALTGRVVGWVDLAGLQAEADRPSDANAVLNGIAYDAENDRIFVTGKLWPKLYEIRVKLKE